MGELEDSTHSVRTGGDGNDVLGVLDGDNDTGSEHEFLPGLSDVKDVDTILTTAPDVFLHGTIGVFGSRVNISREHHLDVLFPGETMVMMMITVMIIGLERGLHCECKILDKLDAKGHFLVSGKWASKLNFMCTNVDGKGMGLGSLPKITPSCSIFVVD